MKISQKIVRGFLTTFLQLRQVRAKLETDHSALKKRESELEAKLDSCKEGREDSVIQCTFEPLIREDFCTTSLVAMHVLMRIEVLNHCVVHKTTKNQSKLICFQAE